jgi:hypothetical protein
MSSAVIYADFNNMDSDGNLRLNTVGTIADLKKYSIELKEGLRLRVADGDLMAEIIARAPAEEGVWRGQIVAGPFELH